MARKDLSGGVSIEPMPPGRGEKVEITYSGKLTDEEGSDPITLIVGYGPSNSMFNTREIPMQRMGDTYTAAFVVDTSDTMNLAFKDAHGHVDNNQNQYWSTPTNSNWESYA